MYTCSLNTLIVNTFFTTTGEPVSRKQDEDSIKPTKGDAVPLVDRAFIILSIISIIGLAIAYQHFCGAPIAELNTKLKTNEKEMQAAHKCENNHYNYTYASLRLFFTI